MLFLVRLTERTARTSLEPSFNTFSVEMMEAQEVGLVVVDLDVKEAYEALTCVVILDNV